MNSRMRFNFGTRTITFKRSGSSNSFWDCEVDDQFLVRLIHHKDGWACVIFMQTDIEWHKRMVKNSPGLPKDYARLGMTNRAFKTVQEAINGGHDIVVRRVRDMNQALGIKFDLEK